MATNKQITEWGRLLTIRPLFCSHVWTDYSAFGDIDHRCEKPCYKKSNLCEAHYKEDLDRRKQEAKAKKEAKQRKLENKFLNKCLQTVQEHKEDGEGYECSCPICDAYKEVFK